MLIWQAITKFTEHHCHMLIANAEHQHIAQILLSRFDLNLRAGDALHLAIAQSHQLPLVTYDKHLLNSASIIGVATINPLN